MNNHEFREDFLNNVKIEAGISGGGSCAAFVGMMAQYLENIEDIQDFKHAFYNGRAERRICRVDGFVLDELDGTMTLAIADYDGIAQRTLTRSDAERLLNRLERFIHLALKGDLYEEVEISTPIWDLIDTLRQNIGFINKYRLYIFTDAEKGERLQNLNDRSIDGKPAECQVWDIDRIFEVCTSPLGRQEIIVDFQEYENDGIPCLEANAGQVSGLSSYLCVIPGKALADIYDKYGGALLENNVRSFLTTRGNVNKGIRKTILNEPAMFFTYNNGISATASKIDIKETQNGLRLTRAHDLQIINGGQTTATLSTTRYKDKNYLENIYVQMKLTIIEYDRNDDTIYEDSDGNSITLQEYLSNIISKISRYSNSQNKISSADFFSNHPFHIRMEKHSRRLLAPAVGSAQYETRWFYERARGQYQQQQLRMTPAKKREFLLKNPKNQLITKTDLSKIINSWEGKPHIASLGAETCFKEFATGIEDKWNKNDLIFNDLYFKKTVALTILFRHLEKLISKSKWYSGGYRANIVAYTMAVLHKTIHEQFPTKNLDLIKIWQLQSVPASLELVLGNLAEEINSLITDDNRPVKNVTEWCKKEACWKTIQKKQFKLPADIANLLVSTSEMKEAEGEAKSKQGLASAIELQKKILRHSSNDWIHLRNFAHDNNVRMSDEDDKALLAAQLLPRKIPSIQESRRIIAVLEAAEKEGFCFNAKS